MSILLKHIAFVNDQLAFHRKMVEKHGVKSFRGNLHQTTADKFAALAADLESSDKTLDLPVQATKFSGKAPMQLSLTLEDIEGLPDELIQELSLSGADKTEFAIINAVEEAGGIISLDKLLIALYRKTGEVVKRNSLYSPLSRLANKGLLYYVPGKKGVYSTEQLGSEDVGRLFGITKQEESHQSPTE